ncbi:potassium transporter TrkG [Mycoplasma sp. 6243]|uniref:potassium transporter TrkG n=1 Tax=Mycoplasma sp. 6243 TaxID=3440865 RepID=UPI003EBCB931
MSFWFKVRKFLKSLKLVQLFIKFLNWRRNISQLKYLLIVYFFVVLIFSLLLWSPITQKTYNHNWTSFDNYINALFTTASAFSDTGLVVYDTFSHWNYFGQAIIAILILLGGIGIFALKFFIFNYLLGRQITSIGNVQLLQHERGSSDVNVTIKLIISSLKFLLIVILISSILMSIYFYYTPPQQTLGIKSYLQTQGAYINPYKNWAHSFRFGFFHTISAINNAGFDIISGNSIMPYYLNFGLQIWFIILFVIGGLGYPTIYDIHRYLKHKIRRYQGKHRFSLFTKVSIISYILVFLVGFILTISFEATSKSQNTIWNKVYIPGAYYQEYNSWLSAVNNNQKLPHLLNITNSNNLSDSELKIYKLLNTSKDNLENLKHYINQGYMYGNNFDKTFAIIFTTFSTRSAGFSSVNLRDFSASSILIWTAMMFIGAAPSSTGGGIRTTTFAVLLMTTISVLMGRKRVRMFKRAIEQKTVFMATQTFILAFVLVFFVTLITFTSFDVSGGHISTSNMVQTGSDLSKPYYDPMHIIFEVSSAFGTTGLSTGITKDLNVASKLALILTMFIGQFGVSSTLLVWKRKKSKDRSYEYIDADLAIG